MEFTQEGVDDPERRRFFLELVGYSGALSAQIERGLRWQSKEDRICAYFEGEVEILFDGLKRAISDKSDELEGVLIREFSEEMELQASGVSWDGVVVTQEVKQLLSTRTEWKPQGSFPFPSEVGVELVALFQASFDEQTSEKKVSEETAVFFGRTALLVSMREAVQGDKQGAVILGQSGMGKSVFLARVKDEMEGEGFFFSVYSVSPNEGDRGWEALCRELRIDIEAYEGLETTPEEVAALIWKYFEEQGARPSVLAIDDCHWLQGFLRNVMERLILRKRQYLKILLLGRPGDWVGGYEVLPQLELSLFTKGEIKEAVSYYEMSSPSVVDERHASRESIAERVWKWAGGHPLLTMEFLRADQRQRRLTRGVGFQVNGGGDASDLIVMTRTLLPSPLPRGVSWLSLIPGSHELELARRFLSRVGEDIGEEVSLNFTDLGERSPLYVKDSQYGFRHELIRLACLSLLTEEQKMQGYELGGQVCAEVGSATEAAELFRLAGNLNEARETWEQVAYSSERKGELMAAGFAAERALEIEDSKKKALFWLTGQRHFLLGQNEQAGTHLVQFLRSYFGFHVVNKGRLAGEMFFSLMGRRIRVKADKQAVISGVKAYHMCSQLAWFNHDLEGCVYGVLRAHRLGLRLPLGDSLRGAITAARAMVLASLMSPKWVERQFRPLKVWEGEPSNRYELQVYFLELLYRMGTMGWWQLRPEIQKGRELARQMGDEKMWAFCGLLEIGHTSFSGELEKALRLTRELARAMSEYGEENMAATARGTEACLWGLMGEPLRGLRILEEEPNLRKAAEHEFLALQAGFLVASGDRVAAVSVARELLQAWKKRPLVNYAFSMVLPIWIEAFANLAEEGHFNTGECKTARKLVARHGKNYPHSDFMVSAFRVLLGEQTELHLKENRSAEKSSIALHQNWWHNLRRINNV